jgi:hypothetical protein
MMKWRGPMVFGSPQWCVSTFRPEKVVPTAGESFAPRLLCEFPTSYVANLHAHQSILSPGSGYDSHVDDHDVAIIVLEGLLETQGRTFGPNAFLLHSAGTTHGLRNVGNEPARYLVFEFHTPTLAQNDRKSNVNLREQLKTTQAQTESLVRDNTSFETKAQALVKQNAALETKTGALIEHNIALEAKLEAIVKHNSDLETALAGHRASTSWRITGPLRLISRLLRHIKWRA